MAESGMRRLKNRALRWLDHQMQAARIATWDAQIDPSTTISSEGSIENIAGGAQRVQIGAHSYLRGRLLTYGHGGNICIGDWCYLGLRSEIWSMESVTIGDRVLIAHNVNIMDGTAHSQDAQERHAHYQHILRRGHPRTWDELPGVYSAPIVIEDDVWISFGVSVLQGVRIGARSVIAAGSIVTKDVPPDSMYRNRIEPMITPLQGDTDSTK